jgi:ABC-2 type transport system permease protein
MSTASIRKTTSPRAAVPVTIANVVRSEWIKFRSVRSSRLTLGGAMAAVCFLGLIFSSLGVDGASGPRPGGEVAVTDPLGISLSGVIMGELIVSVLGALLVVNEYSTGQIRTTLAAVPRRLSVLWAKVAVAAAVVFMGGLAAVLVAFFGGQELLALDGDSASITDSGALRALLGSAASLAVIATMGVALGFIMRRTAGAVATLVGVLFLAPTLIGLLPSSIWDNVVPYLPSNAAQATWQVTDSASLLSPSAGAAVLGAYLGAMLLTATLLLRSRDV